MTFQTSTIESAWAWAVEYLDGRIMTEAVLETFHHVKPGVVAILLTHRSGSQYRVPIHPDHSPVFIRRHSVPLMGPPRERTTRTIAGWGTDGVGQFVVLADNGAVRHVTRLEQA